MCSLLCTLVHNGAGETLSDYGPQLAPCVQLVLRRLAMVPQAERNEQWTRREHQWRDTVWAELAPGDAAGLRRYRREIVDFALAQIGTNTLWEMRADCARVLGHLYETVGDMAELDECGRDLLDER